MHFFNPVHIMKLVEVVRTGATSDEAVQCAMDLARRMGKEPIDVADTPGFGDVTLWGVTPEEVAGCFPEFAEPADHCRFRGCTHTHEPDCGVKSAVEAGEIFDSRYKSYLTAREEAGETR